MYDASNCCEGEIKTVEPNTDSNNASVMLESQELNESERDIMKGDTVGDTVYSSRWIINTLKSLSQVSAEGFTSALETDLCMLWDMTADKDVVLFLLKLDIYHLIDHALRSTSNPRLEEILLGIVGNLSSHNEALEKLAERDELVNAIFHYLTDSDAETLLQVIRIFKCFMWNIQTNKTSVWKHKFNELNFFGKCVSFILMSSKKEQLLTTTLELVEQISTMSCEEDNFLETWFDLGELMVSILECFDQLFQNDIPSTNEELNKLKNWLTIYHYIINSETFKTSIQFEKETIYSNATKALEKILKLFPLDYTIPLSDVSIYCIGTSVEIMMWFLKNRGYYETNVIAVVPSLMIALKIDMEVTNINKEDLTQEIELIEYLEKSWSYILNSLDRRNLYTIKVICENILKIERTFSDQNLQELIQSLKISDSDEFI